MDNLCHTLVGAAMGEAGLKKYTRFGTATLLVSANIPDVDVLVFLTDTPAVAFRRGWTHGVIGDLLLPVALTAAVLAWDRVWRRGRDGTGGPPARPAVVLALAYAGLLSHVFLDFLNTYGIRLLMPFSGRWFYGDSVFIVDPWLWLAFGLGVWRARRRGTPAAARLALAVGTAYIAGMLWLGLYSRQLVTDGWRSARGAAPRALMVGPAPLNPLAKTIIVDAGDRYETGTLTLWPRRLRFDPTTVPKNETLPAVQVAQRDPTVRAILVWSRFPYYEVEDSAAAGTRVTVADMRFRGRLGSATVLVADD